MSIGDHLVVMSIGGDHLVVMAYVWELHVYRRRSPCSVDLCMGTSCL